MQTELARARDEVRQLSGEGGGQVSIGLSPAGHFTMLPRALPPFFRRYPDVRLGISEGLIPSIETELRDGILDFYVGVLEEQRVGGEFTVEKLFDNQRVVLCRRGHPLAGATSLRDLLDAKRGRDVGGGERPAELHPTFERYGLPAPVIAVQAQSALSMVTVAASTDLLTIVPKQWLGSQQVTALLVQINLEETISALPICAVARARLPLTPAAQHLYDLFRRAGLNQ